MDAPLAAQYACQALDSLLSKHQGNIRLPSRYLTSYLSLLFLFPFVICQALDSLLSKHQGIDNVSLSYFKYYLAFSSCSCSCFCAHLFLIVVCPVINTSITMSLIYHQMNK